MIFWLSQDRIVPGTPISMCPFLPTLRYHWTLQWKGLNLYDARVFLVPQNDARNLRGFSETYILPPIIMVQSKMGVSPIGSLPFKYYAIFHFRHYWRKNKIWQRNWCFRFMKIPTKNVFLSGERVGNKQTVPTLQLATPFFPSLAAQLVPGGPP